MADAIGGSVELSPPELTRDDNARLRRLATALQKGEASPGLVVKGYDFTGQPKLKLRLAYIPNVGGSS
jgi:hypothetical protein